MHMPTATPPRFHLEPTYTPQAAAKPGQHTRRKSGSGSSVLLSPPGARGAGGEAGRHPPPLHLNHHSLAKV